MIAASASAGPITYNTDATGTAGTGFGASGVASNIALGDLTLACPTCTTQAIGTGSAFNAFTFHLVITGVTNPATGIFVGSSTGGTVFSDVSNLTVNWAPLVLGPGTTNAASGNFGTPVGQSTVQGYLSDTTIPEPATLSLIGGALSGFGILRRKFLTRQ